MEGRQVSPLPNLLLRVLHLLCESATPNPSFERTHTGVRQLAFISFWANRRTPVWAAQLKR